MNSNSCSHLKHLYHTLFFVSCQRVVIEPISTGLCSRQPIFSRLRVLGGVYERRDGVGLQCCAGQRAMLVDRTGLPIVQKRIEHAAFAPAERGEPPEEAPAFHRFRSTALLAPVPVLP